MICGNCGKHTPYWFDKCGYCNRLFHMENCDKQPGSCTCHEINKQKYQKDHPSIEVKKVESKIKPSTKKTTNNPN